ncbi:hypothetical protein CSKR_202804 [Clonorchis sinensis]|uniref:Secreted protein n=1 Tax=Clonorchis sinensis TaxID=79923 RepID=A0A8T1M2U5_CLOSI|nr:hypothetical protein CSKR_202804 [Clonorchis sinensis]
MFVLKLSLSTLVPFSFLFQINSEPVAFQTTICAFFREVPFACACILISDSTDVEHFWTLSTVPNQSKNSGLDLMISKREFFHDPVRLGKMFHMLLTISQGLS